MRVFSFTCCRQRNYFREEKKLKAIEKKAALLVEKLKNREQIRRKDKLKKKEWNSLQDSNSVVYRRILHLWYQKIQETDAIRDGDIGTSHFLNSHAQKIYLRPKRKKGYSIPYLSHAISNEYANQALALLRAKKTSIWRLDVEQFLDRESQAYSILLKKYKNPKNLSKKLQKKYEAIEKSLHREAREHEGKKFGNPNTTIKSTLRLIRSMIFFRHKKSQEREDFLSIHERFFKGKESQEKWSTNCAAFTTKVTLACLIQLDFQLKEEMRQDLTWIQLPFNKKEKLKNLNTHRMIRIFKKNGCIKKINPPEMNIFMNSLFR